MFRISSPEKSKNSRPVATQIEINSTVVSFPVLLSAAIIAGLLLSLALAGEFRAQSAGSDRRFWKTMHDTRKDDQVYVMGKVLSGDAAQANVVILGTSSAREALVIDDEFNALLARQNSSLTSAVNLATGAQSPIETLLVTEAIPPREGQLFVVLISALSLKQSTLFNAIEHGGFMRPPENLIKKYSQRGIFPSHWNRLDSRLLYHARAKRQEFYRYLNYRLKYWIAENVYAQPAPNYAPHLNVGNRPFDPAVKQRQIEAFKADLKQNHSTNLTYVANTLDVLAKFLDERKCRLVIATPPELSREMLELFPNEFRIFNEMLEALQRTHQFDLLDLNHSIAWEPADFRDLTHVNESGRLKWSKALATWLARQGRGKSR